MATQGVVSVIKDGKVVIKAVAGCNGYNAPSLADSLADQRGEMTADGVYHLALSFEFGCNDCLVVMDRENIIHYGLDEPNMYYRGTFDMPEWNPRWLHGTADYVMIVNLDTGMVEGII
jgi:hypothetical protein